MSSHVDGWSKEWARLSSREIRKRIMAEFCEYCGATPTTPCMSKNRTTLWDYLHADRYQAAVWTFNAEHRDYDVFRRSVGPC